MKQIKLKFLLIILACYLIIGCASKNDTDKGNDNYKNILNNSTGNQAHSSDSGKIVEQNQGHESSSVEVSEDGGGIAGDAGQAETNPQQNPGAMQKANEAVSGTGKSGHVPSNKSAAPAIDPNNKAKIDTNRYK